MEREEAARDAVEGADPNGLCGDDVLHGDRTVVKERLQRKSKRAEALEALIAVGKVFVRAVRKKLH